jgi:large subunit ribosomal protein L21
MLGRTYVIIPSFPVPRRAAQGARRSEDLEIKMKYAIIESGGKQYKTVEGGVIEVDRLQVEAGKLIDLDKVLLLMESDGKVTIGTPMIKDLSVKARVLEHFRGRKIIVFKYRPKKRIRVKRGHRQSYSRLLIEQIGKENEAKPEATKTKLVEEKPTKAEAIKAAAPKAKTRPAGQAKPSQKKAATAGQAKATKTTKAAAPQTKPASKTKPTQAKRKAAGSVAKSTKSSMTKSKPAEKKPKTAETKAKPTGKKPSVKSSKAAGTKPAAKSKTSKTSTAKPKSTSKSAKK